MQVETTTTPAPIQPPPVMQRVHTLTLTDAELMLVTASVGMVHFKEVNVWFDNHATDNVRRSVINYSALLNTCREHGLIK